MNHGSLVLDLRPCCLEDISLPWIYRRNRNCTVSIGTSSESNIRTVIATRISLSLPIGMINVVFSHSTEGDDLSHGV